MKTLKVRILICVIIGFSTLNCEKKSNATNSCSDSYVTVQTLDNVSGLVGFDNTNNQYFLNKYVDGTIDTFYTLYPCDLTSDFKKVNLQVVFSGDLFISNDLPKPAIGGQQIFHIKISKINPK